MGSKKEPILPIIRLPVAGILILNTSLIFCFLGIKSSFFMLNFLGKKINRIVIEINSLKIFDKITKATAYSIPTFKNF